MKTTPIKINRVYIDMDGVLVDFVAGALKRYHRKAAIRTWPLGVYDLPTAIGMDADEFWKPIVGASAEWWAALPATGYELPLLGALGALARPVAKQPITIVSVPLSEACGIGKFRWLASKSFVSRLWEYRFCEPRTDNSPGHRKAEEILATISPERRFGSLLIDDSDVEVDAWRAGGGSAILFPAQWNSAYEWAGDPVGQVARELAQFIID